MTHKPYSAAVTAHLTTEQDTFQDEQRAPSWLTSQTLSNMRSYFAMYCIKRRKSNSRVRYQQSTARLPITPNTIGTLPIHCSTAFACYKKGCAKRVCT